MGAIGLGAVLSGCAVQADSPTAVGPATLPLQWPQDLPDAHRIVEAERGYKTLRLYDRTGEHLLAELASPLGHSTYVTLDRIPDYLQQMVIALEDRTFYTNNGVDWSAVGRAYLYNLEGQGVQGGSTITMQLVKNVILPPEERYQITYERKMKEASLAMEITALYPGREGKDQILEWYLNSSFYGRVCYGVEAAAQNYFGKSVSDLTLAEAAMLALVPQNPSQNPQDNFDAAKERQQIVLSTLVSTGYLTPEEAESAWLEPLTIAAPQSTAPPMAAPHFVLFVTDLLQQDYGEDMWRLGMSVRTTLDLDAQGLAERSVTEKIAEYGVPNNAENGAAVIIAAERGEILAMVGSADYYNEAIQGQVNLALAPRQTGSSFKPYTYLAAFEQGYTVSTTILDAPVTYKDELGRDYSPVNIDGGYHGVVSLRRALACSYNVPAVKLLDMIGVDSALNMARRLGITTLPEGMHYGLSLTLGSKEIPLLDHTFAYSVLANRGFMVGRPIPEPRRASSPRPLEPAAILDITDYRGRTVFEYQPSIETVVDPAHVYVLTHVLSDAEARRPAFGASAQYLVLPDRPVATKTGSTDENWEGWCMGYTPQYVVGTWIGNADRRPMKRLLGSTGAGPIYHDIMLGLHEGQPVVEFRRPDGVLDCEICAVSGLLPGDHCTTRVTEVYAAGTEPTEHCTTDKHAAVVQEPPPTPTPIDPETLPKEVVLRSPEPGAVLSGVVYILGTATAPDLWYHKVEYAREPGNWITTELDYMKTNQVLDGVLATWDTTAMANGPYQLRAMVVDVSGNYIETPTVPVTVAN